MKKYLIALLLLASTIFSHAQTQQQIAVNFDKVSVISLLNFVYGDILKKNFAIHPAIVDNQKTVTVHFQSDLTEANLNTFISDLLDGIDIQVQKKKGYYFISPKPAETPIEELPPELNLFFYRSKYRPVSQIIEMTSSLFKVGHFTGQRMIRNEQPQGITVLGIQPQQQPAAAQPLQQLPQQPTRSTAPTSAQSLIDKSEQDAFLFQGTEKEIATLQKLLEQIDVPFPEVFVRGMVYEVTTGDKTTNAFSLALSILSGKIGINIGATATAPNSITISSGSIDAVLGALSSDKRFQSVSSPSLRVKSGSSARFSVGSDVPVLGQAQLDRLGNVVQSVEYKPSGVIFSVQPQIRDAIIDLSISQQLSTFVQTTTGVNNSPTLIKREISTTIGAASGDLIILGGLDEDKTSKDNTGLSFLPAWTRSSGHDSSRSQILLVLQVQRSGGT